MRLLCLFSAVQCVGEECENQGRATLFADPGGPVLDLTLSRGPSELSELFRGLRDPRDVADLLEIPYRNLSHWTYGTTESNKYSTFHIPKKNGGLRKISAPNKNIKILQQKLNTALQTVYQPKSSVQGFVPGRSVKTNALQHMQRPWVLNLDLDDFFPTIHFGRVRGMFMAKPYDLPESVATVLANLCCHEQRLPQGAPTSPIVSNMICAKMDSQLQALAHDCGSWYTRYADDMTFSTRRRRFPSDLASMNGIGQVQIGNRLREVIEQNGFSINSNKVWLRGQHQRQEVTGVTVNDKLNVPKRFSSQIRAMLHAWDKYGLPDAQKTWEKEFAPQHRRPDSNTPHFERVLKGKIEYIGMIRGQDCYAYLKFMDKLWELDPNLAQGKGTPLHLLLRRYVALANKTSKTQRRGYDLEDLMYDLFDVFEIKARKPFSRNQRGEQIDGTFEFAGTNYVMECKWTAKSTSRGAASEFADKVSTSGALTMGLVVSINGWSKHVVPHLKQRPDKRIMLMNGDDLRAVLVGKVSLVDMLRAKRRALDVDAEPFLGVDQLIDSPLG